ncbi:MAG: pteridine-dependent deoxygenase [Pseudomonadota bacterium]
MSTEPNAYTIEVDTRPAEPLPASLQVGLNGHSHPDGPGLIRLGGDFEYEHWHAPPEQLNAIVLGVDDTADADAAVAAEQLYRALIERIQSSDHPYPLRLWNFMPGINRGQGDEERYRRFSIGRSRALETAGLSSAQMCAATAIGTDRPVMQLVALTGSSPGMRIENPRQVSAWNYPRQYGPSQPAFARATGIDLVDGRKGLLISGTASVVGHKTAHPGDVEAQTTEAASNLDALLAHAARLMNRRTLEHFNRDSLARVYVRDPDDWPHVEHLLRARWPALRMIGLKGDICRADLLVEIEAWHCA